MPFRDNNQNAYGKTRRISKTREAKADRYAKATSDANEREVKVRVTCNHSEKLPELYFNNRVSAKDLRNVRRTHIHEVIKLDGKIIKFSKLPLAQDGNSLKRNHNNPDRIDKILGLYGITFQDDYIEKCKYILKDINGKVFSNPTINLDGDLLRFFVIFGNSEIEIVLIDPFHHVATELYEDTYAKNIGKYNYCLSCLKDIG